MQDLELSPKNYDTIKCPHCKAEYLSCEIFMPFDLIGKSDTIVKDPVGKIIYADYKEDFSPNTTEEFICEYCGKAFDITPTTSFKAAVKNKLFDFESDSTLLI